MTSVAAPAHLSTVSTTSSHVQRHPLASRPNAAMKTVQEPTPPHVKQEDESDRGRRRSRTIDDDDEMDLDHSGEPQGDGDPNPANSSNSDGGPTRKRRRSRKGLDKKFECPQKDCGKSYSRAEHLYRHQLNHTPKQIYHCGVGDCNRSFVRLDLCNRHKDRHAAKGSSLNRKDQGHLMGPGGSPLTSPVARPYHAPGSLSPEVNRPGTGYNTILHHHMQHSPNQGPYSPITNTPPTGYPTAGQPNGAEYTHHEPAYSMIPGYRAAHQSPPGHGAHRPTVQTDVASSYGVMSPVSAQHGGHHSHQHNTPQSTSGYAGPPSFPPFSLPPSNFVATASPVNPREAGPAYAAAPPASNNLREQAPAPEQNARDMMILDSMAMPNSIPIFDSDSVLQKSPYVGMPDEFMAYLFSSGASQQGDSPLGHMVPPGRYNTSGHYGEFNPSYGSMPYYPSAADPSRAGYFPPQPQQVMSVAGMVDQNLPEAILSEDKCNEIFEIIRDRFHETGPPVERQKEHIMEGDRGEDTHMLSRKMMQAYIMSYWLHFSDQMPILHKPTFSPDRTPNLLLMAIMTIGAACLDKAHGPRVIRAGAQLSNFLAWHLRWEIFMDRHFRPPAKLWVFQTMLLLELYEKMYSTRELHERAHIHHATTITLMRRGRSLMGKSALDSPANNQGGSGAASHKEDEWWNQWIANESTRRVAFAAFLIDSVHATMFGHSTVMVAHEMRVPLPCDEKLWKATSAVEVSREEARLFSQGLKPISFLEGLKRTLSNQEVHTNVFGRTVLMAGLLSVTWHMNQRDLQVTSLGGGVSQALGGRDKWRGTLTRAFDLWRNTFDKALKRGDGESPSDVYHLYDETDKRQEMEVNIIFESRTVLHHLAHMATHVDIIDCQTFARAKRLLGRAIGQSDVNNAQRRMKDLWAPTARARDATYYALKLLSTILLPKNRPANRSEPSSAVPTPSSSPGSSNGVYGAASGGGRAASAATPMSSAAFEEPYSAQDDVLLNRPWVLYFAALVVWCYGFALEGPCPSYVLPASKQERVAQLQEYLIRFGSLQSPERLKDETGLNQNSALLHVLKDSFELSRWELLHEGARLLNNCIQLNSGAVL